MGTKERAAREKAERRKQREELILSAAEELFLEKGFLSTTISDIAAECELTNAAIYLYYKNKDELVLKVMAGISLHFAGLLKEAAKKAEADSGKEQLKAILEVYNRTFSEYRNYHRLDAEFNILFSNSYPDTPIIDEYFAANRQVLDCVRGAVDSGLCDGSIESDLPAGTIAGMLLNTLNSYVEKISLRGELMEFEQGLILKEQLEQFITLLLRAL